MKKESEINEQLKEIRHGLELLNRNLAALLYKFVGKDESSEERTPPINRLNLYSSTNEWSKYIG